MLKYWFDLVIGEGEDERGRDIERESEDCILGIWRETEKCMD